FAEGSETFVAESETDASVEETASVILATAKLYSELYPKQANNLTECTCLSILPVIKLHRPILFLAHHSNQDEEEKILLSYSSSGCDYGGQREGCTFGVCRVAVIRVLISFLDISKLQQRGTGSSYAKSACKLPNSDSESAEGGSISVRNKWKRTLAEGPSDEHLHTGCASYENNIRMYRAMQGSRPHGWYGTNALSKFSHDTELGHLVVGDRMGISESIATTH
ncbi:hypothetical protein Tco_0555589, partial [Tanacetum coccineum]